MGVDRGLGVDDRLTDALAHVIYYFISKQDKKGVLLVNYNLAWTWGSMMGAYIRSLACIQWTVGTHTPKFVP